MAISVILLLKSTDYYSGWGVIYKVYAEEQKSLCPYLFLVYLPFSRSSCFYTHVVCGILLLLIQFLSSCFHFSFLFFPFPALFCLLCHVPTTVSKHYLSPPVSIIFFHHPLFLVFGLTFKCRGFITDILVKIRPCLPSLLLPTPPAEEGSQS